MADDYPIKFPVMIERVARGLAAHHYARRFGKAKYDPHVAMNVEANWHTWVPEAMGAIEAMREPTEAMIRAADDHVADSIANKTPCGYRTVYPAMIDAALKE